MKESAKSHATFVVVAGIVRPVMNLLMRKKWMGLEKLPAGGFIAAPNHCTEIDPLVVGHMLYNQKRMPHFLAKAGLFKVPVLGFVLRATKQIPVERSTSGANRSLQIAKEIVDEGGAIIIYPEGTLTRDPELWPMKGHTGAARMALEGGIPVVPMAHWGAHEVFPRYAKRMYIFPRKTSRLVVGRSRGPERVRRPSAGQSHPHRGHQRDHGRHHRAPGDTARRTASAGPLGPVGAQPVHARPLHRTGRQSRRNRSGTHDAGTSDAGTATGADGAK